MKCIFIIGVSLFLTFGHVYAEQSKSSGFHDFQMFDFENDQIYFVEGSWKLYWNQLLTPNSIGSLGINDNGNSSWTNSNILPAFGYGTYTTKVILPKNRPPLSIFLPKINSSFKLWVNEKLILETGVVGKNKESTLHRRETALIPIQVDHDTIKLTIQVANFYHKSAGLVTPITIGSTKKLWENERLTIISDMLLISGITFLGLILLILYYSYWRYDKAIFYFSIFSISWGYRVLSDSHAILPHLFDTLPWLIHVKIEYLSLLLSFLMGTLFLREGFKKHFNIHFPTINIGVSSLLAISIVFSNSYYLSYLLAPFFVFVNINIIYIVYTIISSKRRIQSYFALSGIFIGLIVSIYHIYSFNVFGESNGVWINIGYLFAFMMNSLLLGKRFSITFYKLNLLQKETELKSNKIAHQAELINKTNDQLEEKVKVRTEEIEKVLLELKEQNNNLEQFNYIVSHNMRAPVSNIIGLVNVYNKKSPNDPFNKITINKLEESIHALDHVLKDLTGILEARHYVQRPPETILFSNLIEEIKKSISKEIESSKLNMELDFQVKSVKSNGAYWHSIFINLITNAIKYKKLKEPASLRITSYKEGSNTLLTFEDKGLGIDLSENGGDIFGLYKRFHNHIDGKGMGLYMIKTQIESLGGNIKIESEPNIGTKFTITI